MSPTDLELEPRLRQALRVKAEQISDVDERFDPEDRRRSRGPVLIAAAVFALLVVVTAGYIAMREPSRDGSAPQLAGPTPSNAVEPFIDRILFMAEPVLTFQAREYTARAGVVDVVLASAGGTHGLVFDDPALAHVRLSSSSLSGTDSASVQLEDGKDYLVYCPIPGHRAAGMEAVIHTIG